MVPPNPTEHLIRAGGVGVLANRAAFEETRNVIDYIYSTAYLGMHISQSSFLFALNVAALLVLKAFSHKKMKINKIACMVCSPNPAVRTVIVHRAAEQALPLMVK